MILEIINIFFYTILTFNFITLFYQLKDIRGMKNGISNPEDWKKYSNCISFFTGVFGGICVTALYFNSFSGSIKRTIALVVIFLIIALSNFMQTLVFKKVHDTALPQTYNNVRKNFANAFSVVIICCMLTGLYFSIIKVL